MEQAPSPPMLKFGPYLADFRTGELRKSGTRIRLQEKPLRVLALLAEKQGQLVTREELKKRLWPDDTFVDFETGLNTAVSKLRDALSDNTENPRYIETIPRRGYRFVAAVTNTETAKEAPAGHGSRAVEDVRAHSVAVLPFGNLSGDLSHDYISDGMTDVLIAALSKMRKLRVISRTSMMHYQNVRKALPEIARELRVQFIVEGSVLQIDSRVRIAARLIDAERDQHAWTERYEGEFSDVLSFLDRTAATVAYEVARRMGQPAGSLAGPAHRIAPEASQAYLKGRYEFNQYTEAGLLAAMDWFEKASQADPNFALAYSAMAHAYCAMVAPVSALPPNELFGKAEALARKALALDNSIAEARFVLGLTELMYRWDWKAGERETRQALALDPNNATARIVLSIFHLMGGENGNAIDECEHACILDPFSPFIQTALTYCLYMVRRFPELKENLDAGRARLTGFFKFHILQGLSHIHEQQWEPAIEEFRKALETSGACSYAKAHLGYALAAAGRNKEARALFQELLHVAEVRYIPALDIAIIATGLGDKSEALEWLERAYQERSSYLVFIAHDAIFDSLRPEPRFQNLIERLGLPSSPPEASPGAPALG